LLPKAESLQPLESEAPHVGISGKRCMYKVIEP